MIKKNALIILAIIALGIRLLYISYIQPGNAPDEHAHMAFAASIANGKVMTFKEGLKIIGYPYGTLNPLGYIPGSLSQDIFFLLNNNIKRYLTQFTFKECIYTRVGMILWSIIYIALIFLIVAKVDSPGREIILILCLFLPQIIFIQSYCNLDSLGFFAVAYIIYASQKLNRNNLILASALLSCSKLNTYCAYLFPLITIIFNNKLSFFNRFKKIIYIAAGGMVGLCWIIYSWWTNTRVYHSFLGMSAWNSVLNYTPGGVKIFSKDFIITSINSSFGMFGWMDVLLHHYFYLIWIYTILIPALIILIIDTARRKIISFALLSCVVFNIILHSLASFTSVYNPQGRYLIPGLILLFLFPIEKKSIFHNIHKNILVMYSIYLALLFSVANIVSLNAISDSKDNPAEKFFYKVTTGDQSPQFSFNFVNKKPSPPISSSTTINQSFNSVRDSITELAVNFGTFGGRNDGIISLEVLNKEGKLLLKQSIPVSKLRDCQYYHIDINPPIFTNREDLYNLRISSLEKEPSKQVAVFLIPKNEIETGNPLIRNTINKQQLETIENECYINNNKINDIIDFKIY